MLHKLRADLAIAKAPSNVLFPPMKPLMCTKTQPGMPVSFESSSSRSPLQAEGSAFRLSKLSGDTETACTLHDLLLSSYKAHNY